ncbi:GAF domain-containing protein [Lysobacter auxotrophicus]|uniref:GAF domain-containing protein n=1 Tax=Lysobacter auxotrophicus TaxID=2992573 RepID=A0ABM8DHT7_9GAMM|nr:GAF domain-containing protein [Lysobacter auxotrophicus]BDU18156.1 GAF domain-containing protein [Lysobacter auxotrophicus]
MNVVNATEAEICAREPIHLSGAIQPHGYLVSCSWPDWTVRHVSANVAELFDETPAQLLGTSLREHVDGSILEAIADALRFIEPGLAAQRVATTNLGGRGALCDISTHLHQGLVHIEIEPQQAGADNVGPITANAMIGRIAGQDPGPAFFQQVASLVRELTGYDRVMVYRFRADDAGEVIAEDHAQDMEPYLGLRYPATDIPVQARNLYLMNRLRVIPDAGYTPVAIEPQRHAGGAALDLSHHALRSVSPMHLEYLRNMGVGASMSISIVSGGRLWGLIACHHRTARLMPPGVRATADLFGMYVSMRVAGHEQATAMALYDQSQQLGDVLRDATQSRPFADVLPTYLRVIVKLLDADGAMMVLGNRQMSIGTVPGGESFSELCAWGAARAGAVASTHRREEWRSQTRPADGLAGVLSMAFGRDGDGVYCFRKEQIEEVTWAGHPHKATVPTDDGQRIAPRRSFAAWRETVRGESVQWSDSDRRIAERLYDVLIDLHRRSTVNAEEQFALRLRRHVRGESERLSRLAAMLGDMQHLDDEQTRRLAERIGELEQHLHRITGTAELSHSLP